MASYPHHEFQGHSECSECRRPNASEYRVQDARGNRIGRCVITYGCRCDADRPTVAHSLECPCDNCNHTEGEVTS